MLRSLSPLALRAFARGPLAVWPLAALVVVLAACGGSRVVIPDQSGPYAEIPTVRAGMVAEAQPVVPTGNPDLDDFLGEVAAAIDRHDWYGVARAMDPDAWGEQRALIEAGRGGNAAPQIIAESLGLGDLATGSGRNPWSDLDRIEVVTFRDLAVETPGIAGGEGFTLISGDVRLASGETRRLDFRVVTRGGVYAILVPLG